MMLYSIAFFYTAAPFAGAKLTKYGMLCKISMAKFHFLYQI